MISNFNEEAQEILIKAKLEMLELKHPYVGTEHLVLSILHKKSELTKKLETYGLTYNKFKKEILNIIGIGSKKSEFFLYTPLLKKVIENAIMNSKENNQNEVTPTHLFSSLLEVGEGIAIRIFINMNIDLDNIYDEFTEKIYKSQKSNNKKLLLEELGIDITEKAKNNAIDPVIGRDEEVKKIEEILCRKNKNNPLLIGEPGVGKTAIVELLATLISNNNVPEKLKNKRIISLDMASAVSGTKYRGEFEERIKKILEELESNDNIILFIDEIHTIIGAGGAEGAIDASNIFKPALARGKVKCIGATTIEEYKKHFEKDKALERRFQIVNIEEPSQEKTRQILYQIKPLYEEYHKVTISNDIIDKIITLSEKYIYNRYRPDKEIDILDEVCSKVNIKDNKEIIKLNQNLQKIINEKEAYIKEKNIKKAYEYKIKEINYQNKIKNFNNYKEVTLEDVANVINAKTSIPIYEILRENKKAINNIEKTLKDNIIGQNEVIDKLINITKRIKLGYKEKKCTSMLFVGPSGIGKTKLASLYASLISNKTIKIDMSEYAESSSINKFIGSNPGYIGYDDNKYILNQIKDNPNAVIILDEIDKAHPQIINLLYQILENGQIKNAKNDTIKFYNNIIIMTTNKGTLKNNIGFNKETKNNINELIEDFNTPFINRIDNIIYFNQLTEENIITIINNKIIKLQEKFPDINITISKNIIQEIITETNYKKFGARQIDKVIENNIENIIIDNIINQNKNITIDSIFSK